MNMADHDHDHDETDNVSRETLSTPTSETAPDPTDTEQPAAELTDETDTEDNGSSGDDDGSDIASVRREAASWRTQFREAESRIAELESSLFAAQVASTGKLADPTDMPVNAELLSDTDALSAAIDELIAAKPHLKARTFGNVGQHDRSDSQNTVSLGSILRSNA